MTHQSQTPLSRRGTAAHQCLSPADQCDVSMAVIWPIQQRQIFNKTPRLNSGQVQIPEKAWVFVNVSRLCSIGYSKCSTRRKSSREVDGRVVGRVGKPRTNSSRDVHIQNWDGKERDGTVTCMILKSCCQTTDVI
ncbi:hypothetical protein TNCV_447551 [Trichonephila clavipes]|nr:hypothetical protein TNCV_447551 [Trichonephila clavipes]